MSTEAMNRFVSRKFDGSFPVFGIDVPTEPHEDGGQRIHHAKIVVCGDKKLAERILNEHNSHAALVEQRDRLLEAIREVAIPSLRYCEGKYDHDDQARLNLEALIETVEHEQGDQI